MKTSSRTWRDSLLAATVAAFLCGCSVGRSGPEAPMLSAEGRQDEVRQLQAKRLEVLREIGSTVQTQLEAGQASPADVNAARLRLLEAELEMAETREQRLEKLEEMLNVLRQAEESAARLLEVGRISNVDHLNATAARLQAEIALARAQAAQ